MRYVSVVLLTVLLTPLKFYEPKHLYGHREPPLLIPE
jgi:hypothetical protein